MAQKTDGKDIIIDGGDRANRTLILAPGAGAGKEQVCTGRGRPDAVPQRPEQPEARTRLEIDVVC